MWCTTCPSFRCDTVAAPALRLREDIGQCYMSGTHIKTIAASLWNNPSLQSLGITEASTDSTRYCFYYETSHQTLHPSAAAPQYRAQCGHQSNSFLCFGIATAKNLPWSTGMEGSSLVNSEPAGSEPWTAPGVLPVGCSELWMAPWVPSVAGSAPPDGQIPMHCQQRDSAPWTAPRAPTAAGSGPRTAPWAPPAVGSAPRTALWVSPAAGFSTLDSARVSLLWDSLMFLSLLKTISTVSQFRVRALTLFY